MGILLSLLRVLAGFVLACIVAGIVATLYVRTPAEIAAVPASEFSTRAGDALTIALSVATQAAIFSVAFALIAAGISEWLGLRNVLYWLAAGMGIALLGFFAQYASESPDQPTIFNSYALVAYVTAGFFGGLVYWLTAGRYAGLAATGGGRAIASGKVPRIVVDDRPQGVKKGSLSERLANRAAAARTAAAAKPPAEAQEEAAGKPAAKTPPAPAANKGPATSVPITKSDAKAEKDPQKGEPPKST